MGMNYELKKIVNPGTYGYKDVAEGGDAGDTHTVYR
jgi:hypothetical protein